MKRMSPEVGGPAMNQANSILPRSQHRACEVRYSLSLHSRQEPPKASGNLMASRPEAADRENNQKKKTSTNQDEIRASRFSAGQHRDAREYEIARIAAQLPTCDKRIGSPDIALSLACRLTTLCSSNATRNKRRFCIYCEIANEFAVRRSSISGTFRF
jgi:hypothetical protein